jgi:hypothetical protein
MSSENTTVFNANVLKIKLFSQEPTAPDLVEMPDRSNHQVNQPETELNFIDHIESGLARSIDPFPRESLH